MGVPLLAQAEPAIDIGFIKTILKTAFEFKLSAPYV